MKLFKVLRCDQNGEATGPAISIKAHDAEQAAQLVLGEALVRGGQPPMLRAKVYSHDKNETLTMVRLYQTYGDGRVR